MKRSFLQSTVLAALVFLLGTFSGCGSDDSDGGTTGPDNGSFKNPVAAGFKAIGDAADATIGASPSIFASFEFFGPHIASTFTAARSGEIAIGAAAISCLPEGMRGKRFTFDEGSQTYTPVDDPTLPSESVRYVLYQVDDTGNPTDVLTEIGYLQAECRGQLPEDTLAATLNLNGVDVVEVELRSMIVNLPNFIFRASDITLRSPDGDDVLGLLAVADGTVAGTPGDYLDFTIEINDGLEVFDPRLEGFQASIGMEDRSLNSDKLPEPPIDVVAAGARQFNQPGVVLLWNAAVTMLVDGDGVISNIVRGNRAPLEFEDRELGGNGIYACFSGQYEGPLVDGAATGDGCATGTIVNPLPLTTDELAAVQRGYVALLELLKPTGQMWVIAMQLMTP